MSLYHDKVSRSTKFERAQRVLFPEQLSLIPDAFPKRLFSYIYGHNRVESAHHLKVETPSVVCATDEADQPNNVIAHVEAEPPLIVQQSPFPKQGGTMELRKLKGLEIATDSPIINEGGIWIVPSQSGSKKYTVNLFSQTCTCPDYETNRQKCKHIHAVEFSVQHDLGETLPAEKRIRPTYKQEWHEYNLAQTTEKSRFQELLSSLCQGIEEPEQTKGRPRIPLTDMLFAVVFKVYCGLSSRRTTSDLREAQHRGYLSRAPHFNSVCNYLEAEWLTKYLHALITESSLPLRTVERHFAVDSSGFSTGLFQKWSEVKWGKLRSEYGNLNKKDWLKLHITCGSTTNIVTSCIVTDGHAGDSPQFKALIDKTAENFVMDTVCADKAYSSRANLKLVASKAATPYIDFKDNAKPNPKDGTWTRFYHFYAYNKQWFYEHYHRRSNVESTFSMIKAKFGERLRSKSYQAQVNEALCKVLCHNICCLIQSIYEFGVDPEFWEDD